mgnify:CR=1 FL=1
MASATNLTDSLRTRTLKYKHSAATVKNTIYLLAGRVLVAVSDALADAENIFIHAAERIEMPKAAGTAITAGTTMYWDNTAAVMTATVTSNTKCGIAVQDAASAATTVVIEFDNAVNY